MICLRLFNIAVEGIVYESRLDYFLNFFFNFEVALDLKPRCEIVGSELFIL